MPEVKETTFILACDVTNPLCGPNGAAHVFAKQKGGTPDMIQSLDKGLHKFAEIIDNQNNKKIINIPGSGAAGGVGGGLAGMLNARLERGIEVILDIIGFENMVMKSDYVITGEGKIDHQTLMGKAPSGVLQIATRHSVPTIAIGGDVEWCEELEQSGFHTIVNINTDNIPLKTAMLHDVAIENVRRAGIRIGKLLYICQNKTT
jgi:glycerate kinase